LERVSSNEVCEIALERIEDQINENHATLQIPELPIIDGDKIQFIRLFQNLFLLEVATSLCSFHIPSFLSFFRIAKNVSEISTGFPSPLV
jgi:hypothetical protein